MKTVYRDITVINKNGLHTRPSAQFAKTAIKFKSEIFIEMEEKRVNGKSVMGLITLEAEFGKTMHVTTIGEDAEELMDAVEDVIKNFVAED